MPFPRGHFMGQYATWNVESSTAGVAPEGKIDRMNCVRDRTRKMLFFYLVNLDRVCNRVYVHVHPHGP